MIILAQDIVDKIESTIVAAGILGYRLEVLDNVFYFIKGSKRRTKSLFGGYSKEANAYLLVDGRIGNKIYTFLSIEELEKKLIELL